MKIEIKKKKIEEKANNKSLRTFNKKKTTNRSMKDKSRGSNTTF